MEKNSFARKVLLASAVLSTITASAQTVEVTVGSQQGPWVVSSNPSLPFPTADTTIAGPTVISSGLDFTAGTQLSVQWVSGLIAAGNGFPTFDANGNPDQQVDNTVFFGAIAPSFYFNPGDYPTFSGELAGAFADSTGVIVGTPFSIGDSRVLIVPTGASQLDLGINDNDYGDNSGTFTIDVTVVPEPNTLCLSVLGIVTFLVVYGLKRYSLSRS